MVKYGFDLSYQNQTELYKKNSQIYLNLNFSQQKVLNYADFLKRKEANATKF